MNFPTVRPGPGDPLREFRVWSIGLYTGPTPWSLSPVVVGPVLSARDVKDVDAYFVADPFMIRRGGAWHMFFEVLPRPTRKGVIAHATSIDGLRWSYRSVVLEEQFHLSYPHIFEYGGEVYMVPESLDAGYIRLYRATEFPDRFEPVADLIEGRWADPTVFAHKGRWWLFACSTPYECRTLHLFTADRPSGPWRPHPESPIVADDPSRARPGGRVCRVGANLVRFAQDCATRYGHGVRALEILELDGLRFRERERPESPALTPSLRGWNDAGMHHIDAHQLDDGHWIACVDGDTYQFDQPGQQDIRGPNKMTISGDPSDVGTGFPHISR